MPRPDCVEFHERFGRNHRPNEYGDEYERAVEETLSATAEREIEGDEVEETVYGIPLPPCDMSDPAQVETWFEPGAFSLGEHVRKIVQANCEELIRAEAASRGEKITDGKCESQARLHPLYLDCIRDLLIGRTKRNRERINAPRYGV